MADIIKTEKKDGPEADKLALARIQSSLRMRREHWNGDAMWRREMELAAGHHWRSPVGPEDQDQGLVRVPTPDEPNNRITVNIIGRDLDDFLPFLVNRDPQFHAFARRDKTDQPAANLQANLLNYTWAEKRMTRRLKTAARYILTMGTGFLKTGYSFEVDESATPDRDGMLNYDDHVQKDEPWLKAVSPLRILPDWGAPDADLATSRWLGEIIFIPVQDLIANKVYNGTLRSKIASGKEVPTSMESWLSKGGLGSGDTHSRLVRSAEEELALQEAAGQKLVVLYQIWDKKFRRKRVYVDGVDKPLQDDPWPYDYLDGFPYAMAKYVELNGEFFGLGMPVIMLDQQDELNRIRTFEFLTRRRFAAQKIAVNKSGISEEMLAQLDDPDTSPYILVDTDTEHAFNPIPAPEIPADTFNVEGIVKQDLSELGPGDQIFQGQTLPSRTSAAEVRARQGVFGTKTEGKVSNLDDMVLEAGTQLLQHMKANYRVPRVLRLMGEDGVNWRELTKEQVKAEVDIELVSTSKPRFDPELEKQNALQVFQTAITGLQFGLGTHINIPNLFRWLMEKLEVRDSGRFMLSEQDEAALAATGAGAPPAGGPGQNPAQPQTAQAQRASASPAG